VDHGLSPQDSVVYASVTQDLSEQKATKNCFLTRDKDFGDPDIIEALEKYGCKVLFDFRTGCDYLSHQVGQ
jgi:hypothetical protein